MTLVSIGDQVRPGLYRLHSRFHKAVNFERDGRLISVVDPTIGPGPLNIVLRGLKLAQALAWKVHTLARHVKARSLQQRCELAGRVPSCGALRAFPSNREISGTAHAGTAPSILKGLHNTAQGWIASSVPGDLTLGKGPRKLHNPERVASPSGTPTPLRVTTGTVLFEGNLYPFTSRHRYHSTLDLHDLDLDRFQRNLSFLGAALRENAPAKSLAFLLDSNRRKNFRPSFERAFADQAGRSVHQVFNGKLLEGIRHLRGCGVGLTPAGDDFIAGLLLGLNLLQKLPGQNLRPTMDAIFRAAGGDNIFSDTFLGLARHDLLFGRIKDLLIALTSGSRNSVRKAARALFAIGETSGADLATGLFMTLQHRLATGD